MRPEGKQPLEPSAPQTREPALEREQPLLVLGWRLDYERQGIVSPHLFVPLADLKTAAEAVFGARQLAARIGNCTFEPHDLLGAIGALEESDDFEGQLLRQRQGGR